MDKERLEEYRREYHRQEARVEYMIGLSCLKYIIPKPRFLWSFRGCPLCGAGLRRELVKSPHHLLNVTYYYYSYTKCDYEYVA